MANDLMAEMQSRMRRVIRTLPNRVGHEVVNFALDNFRRQGFLGYSLQPWQPLRTVNKKGNGRAILIKSGRYRRSVRIIRSDTETVVVGSDLPYAKAHNEGFKGTVMVRAHKRMQFTKERIGSGKLLKSGKERMKSISKVAGSSEVKAHLRKMDLPKRQILGQSPYLEANIIRLIAAEILKAARTS